METEKIRPSEQFAASANGHTWSTIIMLQGICTTCGHRASWEQAIAKTIAPCPGRRASVATRGHYLNSGGECRLCNQAFPTFYPLGGLDYSREVVGGVEFQEVPACTACDHAGSWTHLGAEDPRRRRSVEDRHAQKLCNACGTIHITLSAAHG